MVKNPVIVFFDFCKLDDFFMICSVVNFSGLIRSYRICLPYWALFSVYAFIYAGRKQALESGRV